MLSPKTRRNLLVALVTILALLIALLLWWFLRPNVQPASQAPAAPVVSLPASNTGSAASERQQEALQIRNETASLQSASKTFAERYGSYSTEANYANLRDVIPLMDASFGAATQAFVDAATPPAEYYAVTTRVISVSVDVQDEAAGTATVTLTTQREEARGSMQNVSVRYEDLRLTFVTEEGTWKVSSATWL
jgi:hypothetical protein